MKRISLCILLWLAIFMISCDNNESKEAELVSDTLSGDVSSPTEIKSLSGCYTMTQQKDSATLNLQVNETEVSGKLEYKRFEKDHNDGTIKGFVRDNLIVANYTFKAEGMSSVREVVFLINNDSLFEGYGEVVVEKDTVRFSNKNQLTYMKEPFVKGNCK